MITDMWSPIILISLQNTTAISMLKFVHQLKQSSIFTSTSTRDMTGQPLISAVTILSDIFRIFHRCSRPFRIALILGHHSSSRLRPRLREPWSRHLLHAYFGEYLRPSSAYIVRGHPTLLPPPLFIIFYSKELLVIFSFMVVEFLYSYIHILFSFI